MGTVLPHGCVKLLKCYFSITKEARFAASLFREAKQPHRGTLGRVFRGVSAAREQAFMPARTTLRGRTPLLLVLRHQGAGLKQLRCIDFTVIGLDGLGHDDGGGVTAHVVLRSRGHGPRHVARVEDAGCRHQQQHCEKHFLPHGQLLIINCQLSIVN